MGLPHLLLVDDSEAILAYESAALAEHYTLSSATTGREALEMLREIQPAALLLDLSMPDMTGDEVLGHVRANPTLARIPVIVISSESARGEASLQRGARAFLPKPIRAPELREVVARVLEEERRLSRRGELALLFVELAAVAFGVPLDAVREVLPQPMTRRVPGPDYLSEAIDYRGSPVRVLSLARRLGLAHDEPLHERKLVVLRVDDRRLAICVDRVREPEVCLPQDVLSRVDASSGNPGVDDVVRAVVRSRGVPTLILEPTALLAPEGLDRVARVLLAPRASPAMDDR